MNLIRPPFDPAPFQGSPAPTQEQFRPSEYTGLLLQGVQTLAARTRLGRALEVGVGSGVVLATLGLLGADHLCGVDVDAEAIALSAALLADLGLAERGDLACGPVWQHAGVERFDTIVANLPQFPTSQVADLDRSAAWSLGGPNGRAVMDPLLAGLPAYLAPGGTALLTHSTILGLEQTEQMLASGGLVCRTLASTLVRLTARKAQLLSEAFWQAHLGRGLLRVGPYEFMEAQLLEVRWP